MHIAPGVDGDILGEVKCDATYIGSQGLDSSYRTAGTECVVQVDKTQKTSATLEEPKNSGRSHPELRQVVHFQVEEDTE